MESGAVGVVASRAASVFAADATFVYRWPLADESLRRLLDERPIHLLPPDLGDWPRHDMPPR